MDDGEHASGAIATKDEILQFLTQVLRGLDAGVKDSGLRERMKAAELLGKSCGAFAREEAGESEPNPIDDIIAQLGEE